VSGKADSANRQVDQIHLTLFTARCVPVQQLIPLAAVNASRADRSDTIFILCLGEPGKGTPATNQL
jgi:hypothetical protein